MNLEIGERNVESVRNEYEQLSQTHKHYSGLRYAILTVFFAITAGFVSVSFGQTMSALTATSFLNIAAKIGGICTTYAFWSLEERLDAYLKHFDQRLLALEEILGYQIYSRRPKYHRPFLRTQMATRLLYSIVAVFWVVSFFAN